MWVDRKTYLITRVNSETVNGRKVQIAFTGIKKNVSPALTKGLFYFGMPDRNVQTIKNTILPTEYMKKKEIDGAPGNSRTDLPVHTGRKRNQYQ